MFFTCCVTEFVMWVYGLVVMYMFHLFIGSLHVVTV
jgi:hypothetical protein